CVVEAVTKGWKLAEAKIGSRLQMILRDRARIDPHTDLQEVCLMLNEHPVGGIVPVRRIHQFAVAAAMSIEQPGILTQGLYDLGVRPGNLVRSKIRDGVGSSSPQ